MQNNSTWALSAPSPIAWPTDAWNVGLTIVAAIGAVVVYLTPAVIYVMFAVVTGQIDPHHPMAKMDPLLVAQLISYVPIAVYLAAVTPALARVPLRELGFRAPTTRDVGIALGGTVVMYLLVTILGLAATTLFHRHDTEAAVTLLRSLSSPGERAALVIMACIIAPMVEELAFRVFLFNALSRYMSLGVAAVVSGLVFGSAHMQGLGTFVTFAVPLGAGGVVLAYVYAKTRCYWANVITHGTFNAISVFAIIFFHATG